MISAHRDLTESTALEEKLRRNERLSRTVIQQAPLGIAVCDPSGRLLLNNDSWKRIWGLEDSEIREFEQHSDWAVFGQFFPHWNELILKIEGIFAQGGQVRLPEVRVERPRPGGAHWIDLYICRAGDEQGQGEEIVIFINDITERKRVEEQLMYLSVHDALTGLYNRAFFDAEMARLERSRQYPVSLLIADVDGLKTVNDCFGHAAGDALLRRAADALRSVFRAEDALARIGGDEFAILLPQVSEKTAGELVQRIHRILENWNAAGEEIPLHISVGCATVGKDISLLEAFRKADEAMYRSKQGYASLESDPSGYRFCSPG